MIGRLWCISFVLFVPFVVVILNSANDTFNPIFENLGIEIDQESEAEAGCLQVGNQLRLVDRGKNFDRLDFKNDPARDYDVQTLAWDLYLLIRNQDLLLVLEGYGQD